MSVGEAAPPQVADPREPGRPPARGRWLALAALAAIAIVALVQAVSLGTLLDVRQTLTAGFAKGLALGYGVAVAAIVGVAVFAPERWLKGPVYAAAAVMAVVLAATLGVGGEAWSMAVALLTMTACWQAGTWGLHAAGQPRLAGIGAVAWLAGVPLVGLVVLALGRVGILTWWLGAVPVLTVGVIGFVRMVRAAAAGGFAAAVARATGERLAAACAAIGILTLALAAVWTAAPELMFDALYGKAWLPAEWSRTGEIGALTIHPVLNTIGFSQLLAVPGHLVGAAGVGRYLQWLAVAAIGVSIWHGVARIRWAPAAAVLVVITPMVFWQATTAFDDAPIVLGAVGLALAIVALVDGESATGLGAAAVVGWLAGALLDLKLHAGALAAGLALGWWLWGRGRSLRSLLALAAGGMAASAWPFILRWVDTGNPVLPAWNNVFRSEYWPAVNEKFNFPFLLDPGALGPLSVVVRAHTDPVALNEAAPIGAFGLLMAALVLAGLFGAAAALRDRQRYRAALALWVGVLFAFAAWYVQFRYLRYLIPAGVVSVILLLQLEWPSLRSRRTEAVGVLAVGAAAIALWPATVAQFWNVPGKDLPVEAALGIENQSEYEKASMPERDALAAFDRVAPAGARAIATAHQRLLLTDGRDLSPDWEVAARAKVGGGLPADPTARLRRYRELGITWAIITAGTALDADPDVQAFLARHGELVYRDPTASVYRFADRPRPVAPVGRCDPRPTADAGCWVGTLDRRPGYTFEEAPAGIGRRVATCPGKVVLLRVTVPRTSAPVNASIVFDGSAKLARIAFRVVPPGATETIAGPTPPDARTATAYLAGTPGSRADRAVVGTRGGCRAAR